MKAEERRAIVAEYRKVILILFDMGTEKGARRPVDRRGLAMLLDLAETEMRDREGLLVLA